MNLLANFNSQESIKIEEDSVRVKGLNEALLTAVEIVVEEVDKQISGLNDAIERDVRELVGLEIQSVELKMSLVNDLSHQRSY